MTPPAALHEVATPPMRPPPAEPVRANELDRLLRDIVLLEDITKGWDEQHQLTIQALRVAIDDLYREAFARLIRALKKTPEATAALREAASEDVVYAVLRHLDILKPSLHERLEGALGTVRPMLAQHKGNVELVDVLPPDTVQIRLLGACDGCPASGLTLREGVEKAIRDACPEISIVKVIKGHGGGAGQIGFVSPFARADDVGWISAIPLERIPEGGVRAVELENRSVLLYRSAGRVSCFENQCAHLGMPLDDGHIAEGVLTCSHHGFQFLLETGECLTAPEVQLITHAVRVVGPDVEVRLS
jgi:nitrite reductase/ring-hydroxylating ferredoxin subunit/Fe-S cluster biogenesis protein NfuA